MSPSNHRRFFDSFARSKEFNPLDAEKWYSVTYNEIARAVSFGPNIVSLINLPLFKGGKWNASLLPWITYQSVRETLP